MSKEIKITVTAELLEFLKGCLGEEVTFTAPDKPVKIPVKADTEGLERGLSKDD